MNMHSKSLHNLVKEYFLTITLEVGPYVQTGRRGLSLDAVHLLSASCVRWDHTSRVRPGEGASADHAAADEAKAAMPDVLLASGCSKPGDLYNCNETALYPWAQPNRSYVLFHTIRGLEKNTNRITLMFCTSADEWDRERPLVRKLFALASGFRGWGLIRSPELRGCVL